VKIKRHPVQPEDVKLAYDLTMSLGSPSDGAFHCLMASHLNLILGRRTLLSRVKRFFTRRQP
jgi:hypothetical protein